MPRGHARPVAPLLSALLALCLSACSSLPDADPIAEQMRSGGGSCAPAGATPALVLPAPFAATAPTPPRAQPDAYVALLPQVDLQGQMSIKLAAFGEQAAKGLSLGFFFSGNAQNGQLDLMTLMGSQMARVNWQPGEVWLTDDKGRQRYDSVEALSQAALGEALPLAMLVNWMQGRPAPDLPSAPGEAPDTFIQQGWLIDTHDLPQKKLQARREGTPAQRGVQLKIYLDR